MKSKTFEISKGEFYIPVYADALEWALTDEKFAFVCDTAGCSANQEWLIISIESEYEKLLKEERMKKTKDLKIGDKVYISAIGSIKGAKIEDIYESAISVLCDDGSREMVYAWSMDLASALEKFIDGINDTHGTNYTIKGQ